jgi:hypothetical protein
MRTLAPASWPVRHLCAFVPSDKDECVTRGEAKAPAAPPLATHVGPGRSTPKATTLRPRCSWIPGSAGMTGTRPTQTRLPLIRPSPICPSVQRAPGACGGSAKAQRVEAEAKTPAPDALFLLSGFAPLASEPAGRRFGMGPRRYSRSEDRGRQPLAGIKATKDYPIYGQHGDADPRRFRETSQ